MQFFFSKIEDKKALFSSGEKIHLTKVLRKKTDDLIKIIDGTGFLYTGKIINLKNKNLEVEIIKKEKKEKKHNYYLHLAIAPTKNINRFEWFLEKGTEIGIDEITPIICKNSERKKINIHRCNRILISSLKQSLKYHLPKLNEAIKFDEFIKQKNESKKYIAHCKETEKIKIEKDINASYTVLIGPEGDFSDHEIEVANNNNYESITLGESRLRTETAGILATHNIYLLF